MQRRLNILLVPLTLIAVSLVPAATWAGPSSAIVGSWSMTGATMQGKAAPLPKGTSMTLSFSAKGKFDAKMKFGGETKTESGTYKVAGNKLTTVISGKTETMNFSLKSKKLTVSKDGMEMVFSRAGAKAKKKKK